MLSEKGEKAILIDSNMTYDEAFDGLPADCPPKIKDRQRIVSVKYYSFDNKVHQGQIVIDKDLVSDIEAVFDVVLSERFPIHSVIPISHPKFRKNGRWDDELSMLANNTSAFNFRYKTGRNDLSHHAFGRAIDLNTVQNPYIRDGLILPRDSSYDPSVPGTLSLGDPIVNAFLELGWIWGGTWSHLLDYQHFEKPLGT